MLVFVMNEQLVPPQQVCQTCLLADRTGNARWQAGTLRCGQALPKASHQQPALYQCPMGFQVASIDAAEL